jgi:lipoprotein-anchoring transpeptidase ErfK/SrfK
MFEKITAIAAAASCAGLIVAFAPGFAPEVVAGTSQPAESSVTRVYTQQVEFAASAADFRKAAERNHNGSQDTKIICERPWPYYDRSCLRDHRLNAGTARVVRVIANDRTAASTAATATRNAARKFADAAVLNVVRVARVTYAKH